jgi:FdhD protein
VTDALRIVVEPTLAEAEASAADDGAPARGGVRSVPAVAWRGGRPLRTIEHLADEVPVALEFNGVSHAVMLASPADLEDFALGFSLTEGLIDRPGDLLDVELEQRPDGIVLHLHVTARCEVRLKDRRRSLAGRTGCGLCGTDRLDQVLHLPSRPLPTTRVRLDALQRAVFALDAAQPLKQATGSTHAAAWCDADGVMHLVREDVGRHNALDKLIGALHRTRLDAGAGLVAVTSRASLEMVHKTAATGIAVLAARSAPTHLAVQVAQQAGLLLAGYVRDARATVYAGAERLTD